ncbi:hypothetical protein VPH35_001037 [Triticum aestivum]
MEQSILDGQSINPYHARMFDNMPSCTKETIERHSPLLITSKKNWELTVGREGLAIEIKSNILGPSIFHNTKVLNPSLLLHTALYKRRGHNRRGRTAAGPGSGCGARAEGLLTAQIRRRRAGRAGRGSGKEGLVRGGALGDAHPAAKGPRRAHPATKDCGGRGGALGREEPAVHDVASGGHRGERRRVDRG